MPKGKAIRGPSVFNNPKDCAIVPNKITGFELVYTFHWLILLALVNEPDKLEP
jgi:hypothetical protein